jgi:Ca-activated chloride channel homolog
MMRPVKPSSLFLVLGLVLGWGACGGESSLPGGSADTLHLDFAYSSEKEGWIREATAAFNASGIRLPNGRPIRVEALAEGSGELVEDLVNGVGRPHLVSPASAVFLQRGNALSRARTGQDLVGETRNLVLSPLVVAMARPRAEALGWGRKALGWSDLLAHARHTHPRFSNSGLLALLAEIYAATGKEAGLRLEDLTALESTTAPYGSSTGYLAEQLFAGELPAAVLYENQVIESYASHRQPIVAVYPREGTFWSDHPVGLVERDWVTPEHREAAEIYVSYLLARPQQELALRHGFRPADTTIPLGAPFDAAHGVDPREPQTTLAVPSGEVVDAALELWQRQRKPADVTLVLDLSASLNEKLADFLAPENRFSLLTFGTGGMGLYDAVGQACDSQRKRRPGGTLIVLTDGEDTDSSLALPALLETIREESGIRVFTIGYGPSAPQDALEVIAAAGRGRFFPAAPANLRTVFREIAASL